MAKWQSSRVASVPHAGQADDAAADAFNDWLARMGPSQIPATLAPSLRNAP
jgi:hypothetical protein